MSSSSSPFSSPSAFLFLLPGLPRRRRLLPTATEASVCGECLTAISLSPPPGLARRHPETPPRGSTGPQPKLPEEDRTVQPVHLG